MRKLLALALALASCGPADRRDGAAAVGASSSPNSDRGPDPIIVRIPRDGGPVRAFAYPALDSLIWTSPAAVPAPARVLAFDEDAGSLAIVDRNGRPVRVDFRRGDVTVATKQKLAAIASTDGRAIYGVTDDGAITRLTPTGDWSFEPDGGARQLIPQPDGSLLVLSDAEPAMRLVRLHPPDTSITASTALPTTERTLPTRVGDRVYFVIDSGLVGVRGRDLTLVPRLHFDGTVRALAPTPSGDRIFVLTRESSEIAVVDRYRETLDPSIPLGGEASELRMDPLGRYLLARAAEGDSAWVIAVGTGRVLGTVETAWRGDLPMVLPDGAIALARGNDVALVAGDALAERSTVDGGASDHWYLIHWNGFRPRAAGLDTAVTFAFGDSTPADSAADSLAVTEPAFPPSADSAPPRPTPSRPVPARPAPRPAAPPPPAARAGGFTVSFAALLSEPRARDLAASIAVEGQAARVVPSASSGTTVYRVVLGPYATRDEADRIGRESKRSYWIIDGPP